MKDQIREQTTGAAQPQLPIKTLVNFTIPVPNLDDQCALVKKLRAFEPETQRLASLYERKLEALEPSAQPIDGVCQQNRDLVCIPEKMVRCVERQYRCGTAAGDASGASGSATIGRFVWVVEHAHTFANAVPERAKRAAKGRAFGVEWPYGGSLKWLLQKTTLQIRFLSGEDGGPPIEADQPSLSYGGTTGVLPRATPYRHGELRRSLQVNSSVNTFG